MLIPKFQMHHKNKLVMQFGFVQKGGLEPHSGFIVDVQSAGAPSSPSVTKKIAGSPQVEVEAETGSAVCPGKDISSTAGSSSGTRNTRDTSPPAVSLSILQAFALGISTHKWDDDIHPNEG